MVNTLRTNTSPRLPHFDPNLEEASRGWDLAGLTDTEIDDHIAGLSWRCGIGAGTAADHLRIARALVDLPLIRSHFARGAISYSQVRALIRAAGLLAEAELIVLAQYSTGAQLERLIRSLRSAASTEEEQTHRAGDYARWRVEADGALIINARLTGSAAAAWLTALDSTRAHRTGDDVSGPTDSTVAVPEEDANTASTVRITDVEVFTAVAEHALTHLCLPAASDTAGTFRGNTAVDTTVTIVANLDALNAAIALNTPGPLPGLSAETPRPTVHWDTTSAPASITTLATLLHDSHITLIAELTNGTLIDLGRTRRRPTTRIRRAVLNRHDHRCAHPHCHTTRKLHLHHIRHWADGGTTSLHNLIPLCLWHHRALHHQRFTITPHTTGYTFHAPSGEPITPIARNHHIPRAPRAPISHDPAFTGAHHSGHNIINHNRRGEPIDHAYATNVLLQGARGGS